MLRYRDIASMLGHAKDTTMWEQWQIAKGFIAPSREESTRDYYNRQTTPAILQALQERYSCRLGMPEVRQAHDLVNIQASAILDRGHLPIGDATHLFVRNISSEGYTHLYGYAPAEYLVLDAIRASLIKTAFRGGRVAMFLFIGGGDEEKFIVIPESNEIDDAVAGVIEKFNDYVARDVEPDPDYAYDGKALMAMAAAESRDGPSLDASADEEFVGQLTRYEEIKARQSVIAKEERELKKQREFINGFFGARLRGHSRAYVGNKVIEIKTMTRNVSARIEQWSQVNIKD